MDGLNTRFWAFAALLFCLQVNIIPVIAKADTISKSELHKFKIKIMSELVSNGVQIYQFPLDDETVAKVNTTMNVRTRPRPAARAPEKLSQGVFLVFPRAICRLPWLAAQRKSASATKW